MTEEPTMPATAIEPMPTTQTTPLANTTPAPAANTPAARDINAERAAAQAVLERLFTLYPKMFGGQFLPLKLGAYKDLVSRHPEEFKAETLKMAMGMHARSMRYLEAVAAGHARHDLDGNLVEPVSPEHIHHAILEVFRRRQARSRADLRPRLRVLLMEAVEASGLGLDDYAERVRVQDEDANALLADAIAALKLEAAKREALMATFNASGKTEAEFADMYGMHPAEVADVVTRVRQEQVKNEAGVLARQSALQAEQFAGLPLQQPAALPTTAKDDNTTD